MPKSGAGVAGAPDRTGNEAVNGNAVKQFVTRGESAGTEDILLDPKESSMSSGGSAETHSPEESALRQRPGGSTGVPKDDKVALDTVGHNDRSAPGTVQSAVSELQGKVRAVTSGLEAHGAALQAHSPTLQGKAQAATSGFKVHSIVGINFEQGKGSIPPNASTMASSLEKNAPDPFELQANSSLVEKNLREMAEKQAKEKPPFTEAQWQEIFEQVDNPKEGKLSEEKLENAKEDLKKKGITVDEDLKKALAKGGWMDDAWLDVMMEKYPDGPQADGGDNANTADTTVKSDTTDTTDKNGNVEPTVKSDANDFGDKEDAQDSLGNDLDNTAETVDKKTDPENTFKAASKAFGESIKTAGETVQAVGKERESIQHSVLQAKAQNEAYIKAMQHMTEDYARFFNSSAMLQNIALQEVSGFEGYRGMTIRQAKELFEERLPYAKPNLPAITEEPAELTQFKTENQAKYDAAKTPGGCETGPRKAFENACNNPPEETPTKSLTEIDKARLRILEKICDGRSLSDDGNNYVEQAAKWCQDETAMVPFQHAGHCIPECDNPEGSLLAEMFLMSHPDLSERISESSCATDPELGALFRTNEDCCQKTGACYWHNCDTHMYTIYQACANEDVNHPAKAILGMANNPDLDPEDMDISKTSLLGSSNQQSTKYDKEKQIRSATKVKAYLQPENTDDPVMQNKFLSRQ